MRANGFISLAASLILTVAAAPSRAGQGSVVGQGSVAARGLVNPAQRAVPAARSSKAKHIWTNADLDELRAKGLISVVGLEAAPAAQAGATAATAPTVATAASADAGGSRAQIYPVRELDPAWYAEQAAAAQAELDVREAALRDAQIALQRAASGITEPGVAMDRGNAGVTPEAGIAVLQAKVAEVRDELDALADLARRNGIAPGTLRS